MDQRTNKRTDEMSERTTTIMSFMCRTHKLINANKNIYTNLRKLNYTMTAKNPKQECFGFLGVYIPRGLHCLQPPISDLVTLFSVLGVYSLAVSTPATDFESGCPLTCSGGVESRGLDSSHRLRIWISTHLFWESKV